MAIFFIFYQITNAGFFSFLENLLGTKNKNEKTLELNSQNIPLLSAALNSQSILAQGGGDITIVNNNALLPEIGPLGTMADIAEMKPGQDEISLYTVREGDNLSQIAEMYEVSVNTIRWANDLKGPITPGQNLVILPVSGVQYTTKKGDTLKGIAEKLHGDVDEIVSYNNLLAGAPLKEGETILIPNGDYTSTQTNGQANASPKPSLPSYSSYYMRPAPGGYRSQGIHGYNAIDIAASCGTPIYASASGNVLIARSSGYNAGYGSYAVIGHGNKTQTLYAHLSKVSVSTGAYATKGQVIGYMGSTGKSTGCHLHFEIRGAKNPF